VIAVKLEQVSKSFRCRNLLSNYTTLKSFLFRLTKESIPGNDIKKVITNINLTVSQGTTLGIIGRNGSGKTTLLKLICGILLPDSGSIQVNGRVSSLLELGIGFHPIFSGRENIYLNGTILGLSKREIKQKYDEIVRFAELEEYIDYPVRTYSSGMFMRLAFSIATHLDPDILLIDEILAVGDESFIRKCNDRIAEFKREKKTIIIVSHDLFAIERLCDEALWLDDGIIKEQGTPRMVIDRYRQQVLALEEEHFKHTQQLPQELKDITAVTDSTPSPSITTEESPDQKRNRLNRWGSMEVEITGVRFLDYANREKFVYFRGEPMTIEINYRVNKPVDDPVFGFAIYTPGGIRCYGTNTMIEGIDIPHLSRDGQIKILLKSVDFIEGTYQVDVAVHSRDGYDYDYQTRLYSFAVRADRKDLGIYRIPHQWVISP
jgi:ABC-2 type transport system ATP-binding protein/lipopolysaccharide transport system ATP-binding protein